MNQNFVFMFNSIMDPSLFHVGEGEGTEHTGDEWRRCFSFFLSVYVCACVCVFARAHTHVGTWCSYKYLMGAWCMRVCWYKCLGVRGQSQLSFFRNYLPFSVIGSLIGMEHTK